jgi:hypothetical protein
MPRQLRIEYPGAIYHVMSRGDRREDIFVDDVAEPTKVEWVKWAKTIRGNINRRDAKNAEERREEKFNRG